MDLGNTRQAIDFHDRALAIAQQVGNIEGEGSALCNSALGLYRLGHRPEALARAEEALKIFERMEHPTAAKVRQRLQEWHVDKADGPQA
jgi:tetratricopeptide (TPR) repeat protein